MSKVVFSNAARADRREITTYTVKRFGVKQAQRLRQAFQAKIASLANAPLTGHRRQELDPPGRSFRYVTVMKRFIIVYEPADDGIRVVRLLHGAQNLARELARDAGEHE
jgi:plasmid stabilization system protein ParE